MNDDIFESVPQRGSGEETAENSRIHEVSNELLRRCQLYEAQLRNGEINVNHLDIEQRVAYELFATSKANISMHIAGILRDKELDKDSVVQNNLTTATDGKRYNVVFYS